MNKAYKVIWSEVKHCYIVVSEKAKSMVKHAAVAAAVVLMLPSSGFTSIAEGDTTPATGGEVWEYIQSISGINSVHVDDVSVLVGDSLEAYGDSVVVVGNRSSVAVNTGTVVGVNNTADGNTISIFGSHNEVTGNPDYMVVLGDDNFVGDEDNPESSYRNGVIAGYGNEIYGNDNVLIGNSNISNGDNNIFIGKNIKAGEDSNITNAIAIGNGSTPVNDALSIGSFDNLRRIVNVADGTAKSDVSTVGQTGSKLVYENNLLTLQDALGNGLSSVTIEGSGSGSGSGSADKLNITMDNLAAEGEQKIKTVMSSELDERLSNVADIDLSNITSNGESKIISIVEDNVSIADKDLYNISDEGIGKVKTLAKESINVTGTERTSVIKSNVDGVDTYTVDVAVNGAIEENNTGLVDGGTIYTAIDTKADKDNVYTKEETNDLLDLKANITYVDEQLEAKADKDAVYTKEETNGLLDAKSDLSYVNEQLDLKADKESVYTKDEADALLVEKASIDFVNEGLETKADKSSVYTKEETDTLLETKADIEYVDEQLDLKADKSSVYSKEETDGLLDTKADKTELEVKADKSSVYTKEETNGLLDIKADKTELEAKADKSSVYTKEETNGLLDVKADKAELEAKADKNSVYTKGETDGLLEVKADKSSVYTKEETDGLLDVKADKAELEAKADKSSVYTKEESDGLLDAKANKDFVYSKSDIDEKLVMNDGTFISGNNTLAVNLTALDTAIKTEVDSRADFESRMGVALDKKANVSLDNLDETGLTKLKNATSFTEGNHVSISRNDGDDTVSYLVSVKEGTVAEGDTELVTGDSVYRAIQNITQPEQSDTHYVGINSSLGLSDPNYNGAGASAENSIAIGSDAKALEASSIALGSGSVADEENVLSVGSEDIKRKIVNVKAGESATDAATVSQTIVLEDGQNTVVTSDGTNDIGQAKFKIDVKTDGLIEENNTGVVTGGTVFEVMKSNVQYDTDAKDLITMAGNRGTKITNVKAATLSKTSSDVVVGAQLWATNQQIAALSQSLNTNREDIATLNQGISNAIELAQATGTLVDTLNQLKADVSLNNLTDTGKQVIVNIAREVMGENTSVTNNKLRPVAMMAKVVPEEEQEETPDKENTTVENAVNDTIKPVQTVANNEPVVMMKTVEEVPTATLFMAEDTKEYVEVDAFKEEIKVSDGNHIRESNTVGENLTALDTAIGMTNDGAYISASNSVGANLNALDNQVAINAENIGELARNQSQMRTDINKIGAKAGALAGLHPFDMDSDQRWNIAAGYGNYKGENSGAVGVFYKPSDRVMLNLASTIDDGDNIVSAGVSVALDKGSRKGLSEEVKTLKKQNAEQAERIAQLERVVTELAKRK